MPPRASRRRQPRFSVREPDTLSYQNPITLQKPNLPPLQGTPSSRRQYSYGAEVEPMPTRPTHGQTEEQPRDIGTAVRHVLVPPGVNNEEQQNDQGRRGESLPSQQDPQKPKIAEPEPDELAGGQQMRPPHLPSYLSGPSNVGPMTRPLLSLRNPRLEGSDADDARSFGIESDFYGDATISSTPRAPVSQQPVLRRDVSVESASTNDGLRRSARNVRRPIVSEDEVDLVRQPQNGYKGPAKSTVGPSPLRAPPRRPPARQAAIQPRLEPQVEEDEEEEEEEEEGEADDDVTEDEREEIEEEDELIRPPKPTAIGKTNTPAAKRSQPVSRDKIPRTRVSGPSPAQLVVAPNARLQPRTSNRNAFESQSGRAQNSTSQSRTSRSRHREGRRDTESDEEGSDNGRWLNRANATSNFSNLISQAKFLVSSSPFSLGRRYPSDESELDAIIQRDIDAAEAEVALERQREEAEAARLRSEQRWLWLTSLWPFASRRQSEVDAEADGRRRRRNISSALRFFNPMTYVRGIVWLVQMILDWIMELVHFIIPDGLWDRLSSVFGFLPHILAGALAFVAAFVLATQLVGSTDRDWAPNAVEATLEVFEDMRYRISDLIPTVTWPRRNRWVDIDDLWDDDDSSKDKLQHFINRMEEEFLSLKRSGKIHDASIQKLETVLPSIVHMELRDGRPVISEEFWHALRDLIHADGGFLALDKVGNEYVVSSDRQWSAITSRLIRDSAFTNKLNHTVSGLEDRMSRKMTTFWDKWVKDNDDKIAQMLGTAVDQIKPALSQKEFEDRLTKLVNDRLAQRAQDKDQGGGKFVPREEFLRHIRNELSSLATRLKAELDDLQPRMQQLVQKAVDIATKDLTHGMSRADVTTLVNTLIRKALADINLEAMARGKIHSHWDTELRNQVNYFATGSGAKVDPRLTSATWDPKGKALTPEQYEQGWRGSAARPPLAALESWEDEGDCWCAARSVNHRGNPHGATLSVQLHHSVIPQHIVVEHILPGGTTQPGARPRSIEVWAEILDSEIRERILDFGSVYFPDDESDWNFTPPDFPSAFVKISQFVYEGAELHDGVHVHRLSSELLALGAHTDRVVVRAVNNYGAGNHTCFYRVRLYGFNVELDLEDGNGSAYY